MIKVLLFAQIADLFEQSSIEMEDISTTGELISILEERNRELSAYKYVIAVNEEIVKENTALNENDVVALLPPFAGG